MLIAHGYPGVIELARANQTSSTDQPPAAEAVARRGHPYDVSTHDRVVWTIVRTGESRIWLSEFR